MSKVTKAMFWKEYKVFVKSTVAMVVFYTAAVTGLMYYLLKQMSDSNLINMNIVTIFLFLYIIIMMAVNGGVISSFSMGADNREGILNSLIGTTNKASELWLGQFLFCSVCPLLLAFIGSLGLSVVLKVVLNFSVQFDMKAILLWFIIAPAIGMLYNALNLFLVWVIRYQAFALLPGMVLPLGLMFLMLKFSEKIAMWNISIWVALIIGVISVILTLLFAKLIDIIPKQNYVCKV